MSDAVHRHSGTVQKLVVLAGLVAIAALLVQTLTADASRPLLCAERGSRARPTRSWRAQCSTAPARLRYRYSTRGARRTVESCGDTGECGGTPRTRPPSPRLS